MENTDKQINILNKLAEDLANDVSDVRTGKLKVFKARAISSLSCKIINSVAKGIMTVNHHEIQLMKIKNTADRTLIMGGNTPKQSTKKEFYSLLFEQNKLKQ
jgi:hypothetical protein